MLGLTEETPQTIKCESVLEAELVQRGAVFTPLELRLPETMEKQAWSDVGRKLLRADQVMQWWIGDWAAFGAGNPDKDGWRKAGALREFCEANGFRTETAMDHAWVSRSVHLSLRKENLQWSYYSVVAPLKPKDQMRWLKAAEKDRPPVGQFRKQIREWQSSEDVVASKSDGPVIKFGTKMVSDLLQWLKAHPADFWTPSQRATWRGILDPIVKFWEGLA